MSREQPQSGRERPAPTPSQPTPDACPQCADLEDRLTRLTEQERLVWDAVPAMVWLKDADNRVLRANRAAAASLGLTSEQVEGRSTYDLYPEEAAAYHQDDLAVINSGRPRLGIVELLLTASGEKRWVRTDKIPARDGHGRVTGVLVFAVDITEQKRAETLLAGQNLFLREVVAGTLLEGSLALLASAVREQIPGSLCAFLLPSDTGPPRAVPVIPEGLRELFRTAVRRLDASRPAWVDLADGRWDDWRDEAGRHGVEIFWCEAIRASSGRELGVLALGAPRSAVAASAVSAAGAGGVGGMHREAEVLDAAAHLAAVALEAVQAREQLLHNARHDPLTDLPNRAHFHDRLSAAMRGPGPPHRFAVLFVDIDQFKVVNDSLGHMRGDEMLQAVALRLRRGLRAGDTVARLGGDEFALLLEQLGSDAEATQLAARIQEALEVPFELGGHEIYSSVSIGIAFASPAYERPEEMLRDADTAMYRAKAQGRSRLAVFQPVMHQRAVSQLKLESALRRALERRELLLYYQPIVEVVDGSISGFEALVRWRHPELGLLLPDEFLPAAEDTGLMPQLGTWVIAEACRQTRIWQRGCGLGELLEIHVNLHALQLAQRSFVEQVAVTLHETGLPPACLNFELTEGVLLRDLEGSIETLHALRDLGVGLSLDDFGTGYSSLNYLLRFPVTALKIDRSFISSIRRGSDDLAIVESINSLAHTLSLDVIAEGVETDYQLEVLRRLGCELAQGFLFSPPVEAEIASTLLASPPRWDTRGRNGRES